MIETATPAALAGRRILVAEDEYLIAEEVAAVLAEEGAEVFGPVSTVAAALRLVAAGDRLDAALLDVSLCTEAIWPVVDALVARGVPVVLATGYDAAALPEAYAHLPHCEKPATGGALTRALARVLAAHCPAGGG